MKESEYFSYNFLMDFFLLIYRSATPQTRSPGGSSIGAERDSSGANTKDRTVSFVIVLQNFDGCKRSTKMCQYLDELTSSSSGYIYCGILLMESNVLTSKTVSLNLVFECTYGVAYRNHLV